MMAIGMLKKSGPDAQQREFLDAKRRELAERNPADTADDGFPASAQLCKRCQTRAMVILDNCLTCLNCGESKCG